MRFNFVGLHKSIFSVLCNITNFSSETAPTLAKKRKNRRKRKKTSPQKLCSGEFIKNIEKPEDLCYNVVVKPKKEERAMVLTIDIGNSNITLGGFTDDELRFTVCISTEAKKTADEYAAKILGVLAVHGVEKGGITGSIISSVVPPLNSVIKDAVRIVWGIDSLVVGPGIRTGVNIHCDTPSSVGADIICACVAVNSLYGNPALIVDMGTATKMTVIDGRGAFVGVSIIPGVLMGLNALSEDTAQLPKVELEAPRSVIGKNTPDSMRSGVIFGNAAMIDGMIERIESEAGVTLPVYATGGIARLIIPHCKHNITIDPTLVLKGLNILYNKNN